MTALTIYDELSPVDLAHGRHIAGTGTIDANGTIGEIGGIEAKARAAEATGAQLFLAPATQAAAARAVLGDRVPVVAVSTFTQALNALSGRSQRAALS
jgi:Lon-like protease